MRGGEHVQLRCRLVGQGGHRIGGDVGTRYQAEQPEHPRSRSRQRGVGQREDRPYPGLVVVLDLELGQPVAGPQLADVVRDRLLGPVAELGRRDPQGERQEGAQLGEGTGSRRLGRHPPLVEEPAEQRDRLVRAQHVEVEAGGAVPGDQPGQPVPAGDHDLAAGYPGQQRPHLRRAARVVEHDQQPPVRDDAAVQAGGRVDLAGDPLAGYPERGEELRERVDRPQRTVRRVAAQVDVELPVGEPVAHPVPPVDGERRLADAGGTGDDRHRDRVRFAQQRVQPPELDGTAGEPGLVGG